METIREILAFLNDFVESELIRCIARQSAVFEITPRVVCIDIAGWLRGRANRKRRYGLPLRDYRASDALRAALQNCAPLAALFAVEKDVVNFRSDVDSALIDKIEAEVLEHYHPPLFLN
jgi:hypothetical protein